MRKLLNALPHWWEIYAPYQPVSTIAEEVHPHRGQVIRYRRLMCGKTRRDVARDLHWSTAYLRKVEARPEGTSSITRCSDLIPYLQISPRLFGLSDDFFLQDTPDGARAALMEKLQPLLEGEGDWEKGKEEIGHLIAEYERTRIPNYLPLSADAKEMYDYAALFGLVTMTKALDPVEFMHWVTSREQARVEEELLEGLRWKRGSASRKPRKTRREYEERLPSHLVQREKLREAITWVETCQQDVSRVMNQTISFRRDQLMYAKCLLYEMLLYPVILKPEIYAELGPEQSLEYLTRWLTCAGFLGNVVLMAPPLLERMNLLLEQNHPEQALEDFHELQFCLGLMGDEFGLWDEASTYVFELEGSIRRARGGMKVRLRSYVERLRSIIEARISERELANAEPEYDGRGLETLIQ